MTNTNVVSLTAGVDRGRRMRMIVAVAATMLLATGVVRATGDLLAYVDWILPTSGPQTLTEVTVAGWGFDCSTGNPANMGIILVDGVQVPALFRFGYQRQDVRNAYVEFCPGVTNYTGLSAKFYTTSGTHIIDGSISSFGGTYFIHGTVVVP
jgi:hypothetical protein